MVPRTASQRGTTRIGSSPEPEAADVETRVDDPEGLPPHVGHVLRRAREYWELSLRDVERRIGRSNAYLSQVERGLIRRPDPVLLLDLADLYKLDFLTLATWAGWTDSRDATQEGGSEPMESHLLRAILQLDDAQRVRLLAYVGDLLKETRT